MTNPTTADIQRDVGDARNVTDGTTAINSFLAKAKVVAKNITGTTTGGEQDIVIRNLADAFTINALLGGLGPESVNVDNHIQQRDQFLKEANESLKLLGKSLDGVKIQFLQVNP